ncbi:MAG: hypothetical protein A2X56_01330 [Nitrospirae bacterium GWC2_57_13]|jgi:hypothetical protein|nr:MAG: hypothetical protein A2072_03400 [Nitrospirae bacterium GWC1_57_7]OGW28944.1 MAG: hypothetical protein A2X56_01330 [Nitrospirae bacterium GWC2_57_13]OGW44542.1 MAG: hypothetical protein A2X57_01095 [Nitrospirae bacterium GWD2_57_8]HAS52637.1 hypothetical protein [Nitrospiraceae bacterium]
MKIIIRIALAVVLLLTGFAAGFPFGVSRGFSTGSEWAFVQGNILAREAGLFMPVNFETGQFRIIFKQPKHLYREAWVLADRHEDAMVYMRRGDKTVNEGIELARNASLPQ